MKARTYECVFILDPGLDAKGITEQLEKFQEQILHHDGLIRKWDRWGKKRLAYQIQQKQYGYYAVVVFDVEPTFVKALDRYLRLSQHVLRHLIVLMDRHRIPPVEPTAELRPEPEEIEEELSASTAKEEIEKGEESFDEQTEAPLEEEKGLGDGATSGSAEKVASSVRDTP